VLDVLITVHVVGSTEGIFGVGDHVTVAIDGARAVLEPVSGAASIPDSAGEAVVV